MVGDARRGREVERSRNALEYEQELTFAVVEQPERPVDRVVERSVLREPVVSALGGNRPTLVELVEHLLGRERAQARGSQLERERDAVEATTQHDNGFDVVDDRAAAFRAFAEQPYGIRVALRLHRRRRLGEPERRDDENELAGNAECFATRARTRMLGCLPDHAAHDLGRGVENLLAIVDDEKERAGLECLDETIAVGDAVARRHTERIEERPGDRGRFDQPAQVDEPALAV